MEHESDLEGGFGFTQERLKQQRNTYLQYYGKP